LSQSDVMGDGSSPELPSVPISRTGVCSISARRTNRTNQIRSPALSYPGRQVLATAVVMADGAIARQWSGRLICALERSHHVLPAQRRCASLTLSSFGPRVAPGVVGATRA